MGGTLSPALLEVTQTTFILSIEDAPAGGPGPARASFNDVLELLAAASSWGIRCNLLQFQPQQVRQE